MDSIHIVNPAELEQKVRKLRDGGVSSLHVVSDFDRTLTPAFFNGERVETGVGQIRAGGYLSPEYVKKAYELKDKYYPIEIDDTIPVDERSRKMQEWWETHLKVMVEHGLHKGVIDDIIKKRKIKPRQGSLEFYDTLHRFNVPLLIFSAGKGDLIKGFLEQEGRFYDNIHIIANFFDYDINGLVKGYKSGVIHTFNKNESQIRGHSYYNQIKFRENVILLGDGLGDVSMAEGLEHETIIRVGFLNENIEKHIVGFSACYDVLILNDGSMDYVNDLLKTVLDSGK